MKDVFYARGSVWMGVRPICERSLKHRRSQYQKRAPLPDVGHVLLEIGPRASRRLRSRSLFAGSEHSGRIRAPRVRLVDPAQDLRHVMTTLGTIERQGLQGGTHAWQELCAIIERLDVIAAG